MKEALYYKHLKNKIVQCQLCPKFCTLKPGEFGNCNARKNIRGKLYSLVYAKPCAIAIDPIEKKPLFHFMPGSKVYSIGTTGCNLHCKFCQNWTTSQTRPDESITHDLSPKQAVEEAINSGSKIIAYTYNEPIIFYEYVLDTAKLARKKGLKNIIVSNGFINQEPLKELIPYLDAANIDLKAFDNDFYKNICDAKPGPVLETIKTLHKNKVHLEITNLVIPTLNDNPKMINDMCEWIVKNIGKEVPLHFTAFYPCYKLTGIMPTQPKILINAGDIALKKGIKYVYVGNIAGMDSNTNCPKCKKLLIQRNFYNITESNIINGKCKFCKQEINGVWE